MGLVGGIAGRSAARSGEEREGGVASPESRKRAASALIESHDRVFRRTARRYSICAEDAEDAYQRALEILLTKAPSIEGDSLVRWMQTVTKREALAVRRQRERLLGSPRSSSPDEEPERDPLDSIASEGPGPDDRAGRRERVTRSGEALQALKPQEVRALTLKAQGYSYAEIGEITGWSYTKINRCMAEGRKRFLQVFADIEQGRRCEELAGPLSALADGEAPSGANEALEFHLRSCAMCRAKLREFRAIPEKVLELLPLAPAIDQSIGGRPHEWIADHAGAALEKVREMGYGLVARGAAPDAAPLASAGGTRGAGMAAIAKVLAVCGATAAGGAACVAGGVVAPGIEAGSGTEKPVVERPADPVQPAVVDETTASTAPQDQADVVRPDPAPAEPPVQQRAQQFSFEASDSTVDSSVGGGGGEFGGPSTVSGGSGGGGRSGGGFGIE